jgi:peptide/nickel transport system substrate-binding protein
VARALAAALLAAVLAAGGATAAAPTPNRGGSVAVWHGGQAEPGCLNPFGPCRFNQTFLPLVLEGALTFGPDFRFRPNLVSRVEIVSRRPFTLVYRIRPEARWSDGVPVTAADFAFTYRIFRDHRQDPARGDVRPLYRTIQRVEQPGAKTVRVVFRERLADWRLLFGTILPRHALAGEDITAVWRNRIDHPRTGRAIGTGPFLVGSWERGNQLTLVRNPRYWRGRTAHLDRILVRFGSADVPPDQRNAADAMQARYLDVVNEMGMDAEVLARLRRMPGVTVRTGPGPGLEHLVLRVGPGGPAALRDRRVRQALAYGLDRNALARASVGDSRMRADSAIFVHNTRFYRPDWSTYRRNPARARQLLQQAGCRPGPDRIYVCGGERLRLRFLTTTGVQRRERTLELAKEQLAAVGVDVQPTYAAPNIVFGTILPSGRFDVALIHTFTSLGFVYIQHLCGNEFNLSGYCSRQTNRDLLQADLSLDERQRARVLHAADAKLAVDVPVIPLYTLPSTVAHRTSLRGVVPHRLGPHWNAGSWWLAGRTGDSRPR